MSQPKRTCIDCGHRRSSAHQTGQCGSCRSDGGIIGIFTQDAGVQKALYTELERRVARHGPDHLVSFGELFDMTEKAERGEALHDKQAEDKAYWLSRLNGEV